MDFLKDFNVIDWGYTEELSPRSYEHYESWVERGDHGALKYLADHRKDARKSLENIFPEVKSALCFLFSYHPEKLALENFYQSKESNGLKVASYTLGFEGLDYHVVVRDYLEKIATKLQETYSFNYRHSLDIHPVLERDLAYRAGLGWFGKNSMLIHREHGSFFIIGSLLLDQKLDLKIKETETDHCGQCRACIDACPTDAIDEEHRSLIADKCISTWTIEIFKEGPSAPIGMESAQGEIFGCDICQDVCPWNRFAKRHSEPQFEPHPDLLDMTKNDWEEITEEVFRELFRRSAVKRTKFKGLQRNIDFLLK